MNLPNFLIVGTAKGGTTSLYFYLKQHPDIYFSPTKETCFFCWANKQPPYKVARDVVFDIQAYKKLFETKKEYKLKGEATAVYLYDYKTVIENIKAFIPNYRDIKIIIILRDPADRAYSQYMMNVRDLREPLDFEDAIKDEKTRIQEHWNTDFFYLDRGMYFQQVKAYLDNFKNVKVCFFEDLIKDPKSVMKDISEFLEIDSSFDYNTDEKFNVSGKPKIKLVNKIIVSDSFAKRALTKILPNDYRQRLFESVKNKIFSYNLEKSKLKPEIREYLRFYFKDDIESLEILLGKDLRHWM